MRTTATLLACLLGLATAAIAQDWERQSPYPADHDIRDVFFIDAQTGWIVGEDEIVMRTTDGGTTWTQARSFPRSAFSPAEERMNAVEFVDDQHGFIGANDFYVTTDGGDTWTNTGSHGQVRRMSFLTPSNGFITSNSGLRATFDGGFSFDTIAPAAADVDALDIGEGRVLYTASGVHRSTDGGVSFTQISDEPVFLITQLTEDLVIGTRNDSSLESTILRSTDGGQTWAEVFAPSTLYWKRILDLERIDADSVAAIDTNFRVWLSDDGGLTWTETQEPIGSWKGIHHTSAMHFPTPEVGYFAGTLGLISKTTDGGRTWTQINKGAAIGVLDIAMQPSGLGIAVGESMTALRTEDFGRTWTPMAVGDPPITLNHLNQVQIISPDVVMACGFDSVYRSEDAGRTWTEQTVPIQRQWNGLSFLDEQTGWIFGEPAGVYHTTDGGDTWTRLSGIITPGEGEMVTEDFGWVVSYQTEFLRTHNNWDTFDVLGLPHGDTFFDCDLVSETTGWIIGTFEFVGKSTDGGRSFDLQPHPGFDVGEPAQDQLQDVFAIDENEVYLALRSDAGIHRGTVWRSTDGGDSWTPMPSFGDADYQFSGRVSEITVLPEGGIWAAVSSRGYIWATGVPDACRADLDGDGTLTIFDFLAFQTAFDAGDSVADFDGDGDLTIFDFLAFQTEFDAGCE